MPPMTVQEKILQLLRDFPRSEYSVTQLATRFNVSRNYIKDCIDFARQHITVESRKEGNSIYYRGVHSQPAAQPSEVQK